jgi:hypothetical protein
MIRSGTVIVEREEFELGWPGTIAGATITVPERIIEADPIGGWDALPDTWDALALTWAEILPNAGMSYESPTLDLQAQLNVKPTVSVSALGTVVTEMSVRAGLGQPVVYEPLAAALGRYVRIRISVSGPIAELHRAYITLHAPTFEVAYNDVSTSAATAEWFQRIGVGQVRLSSQGRLASITHAQITALQNVGPGWTWEVVSKATMVADSLAAEFKIYNAAGAPADALIDVTLRGPKAE